LTSSSPTAYAGPPLDLARPSRPPEAGGRAAARPHPCFAIRPTPWDDPAPRPWPTPVGSAIVATGDAAGLAAAFAVRGAPLAATLVVVGAFAVVVAATGGYRFRLTTSALDAVPELGSRLALVALVTAIVWDGAAETLVLTTAVAGVALVAVRSLVYSGVRQLRARTRLGDRAAVIGNGPLTAELVAALHEHPWYGVHTVALLQPCEEDERPEASLDTETIGEVLAAMGVRRLIVSYCECPDADLVPVLRAAVASDIRLHLVPRFFDLGIGSANLDWVWGIPLLRVRRAALRRQAWWVRRAIEVVLASILLVLASPLLAAIAAAVRLSSPGPILFRQPRIGQDGRTITVAKFRSLRVDDPGHDDVVIDLRSDEGLTVQARRQRAVERRLTRVGRFLRSTGLDELPQLWSVVKGDMSLVGPRPEELSYTRTFGSVIDGYGERHRLPVGLTGWAQVHGLRGETSIAQRVRFDNLYIEHWSIWRDVVITLRTVGVLARRFLRREA
jgi:exopolysaccharide biosynthesis polyprenyl glycosylphosphotransferase